MTRQTLSTVALVLVLAPAWRAARGAEGSCAQPETPPVCVGDQSDGAACYGKSDATGGPLRWSSTPIDVYVHIDQDAHDFDRAAAIEAIKAAFAAYECLPCTALSFRYAGEEATLLTGGKPGTIYVYFGYDEASWIYGGSGYSVQANPTAEGDFGGGILALNDKDFDWTVGAEINKVDIQTAVMQLVPRLVGIATKPALDFNTVDRALDPAVASALQWLYQPAAGASCVPGMTAASQTGPDGQGGQDATDGSSGCAVASPAPAPMLWLVPALLLLRRRSTGGGRPSREQREPMC